ncbi:MAG: cupin domain-containing protein [Burkholderiales bacterium]|nr:cupin domain-containing protein [Burkholderiales bacterium]
MAVHLNVDRVRAEDLAPGVRRRSLLNGDVVPGIKFRLDCLEMEARAEFALSVAPGDLAWFQVLRGAIDVAGAGGHQRLSDAHVVFLPPGFGGSITAESGAALLVAQVPDAAALDPGFAAQPPAYRVVDWKNEPLLESKHDARKRIYLATPALFGTQAIKGEMIIYPPRTEAPRHYHLGAAHFMYFLSGGGTAYAGDESFAVREGDLVYYDDRETHALRGGEDADMVFSEFFVPAGAKTVWVEPEKACTWLPTGKNVRGGKPSREIRAHSFSRPESTGGV